MGYATSLQLLSQGQSTRTFLPRRIIEFDPAEATVGVVLRGHPFDDTPKTLGMGGGPPLQLLLQGQKQERIFAPVI
jgi:hypothetical protein